MLHFKVDIKKPPVLVWLRATHGPMVRETSARSTDSRVRSYVGKSAKDFLFDSAYFVDAAIGSSISSGTRPAPEPDLTSKVVDHVGYDTVEHVLDFRARLP